MNTETLTHGERTVILARIARDLTVCARDTYEAGTENVLEPQVLRSYNELLHRVTAAVQEHASGTSGFSLETILEMVRKFGVQHSRVQPLNSVLDRAMQELSR